MRKNHFLLKCIGLALLTKATKSQYIRIILMAILIANFTQTNAQTAFTEMRNLSGLEITADMAPGVNLWNTLDANCGPNAGLESETCWGNPFTTLEMVTAFKERGFNTLRIPVTWYNHMGSAPNYLIDTIWMNRVEEVANYAFTNNMYVILNIHHDDYDKTKPGTWLCPTYEKQEEVTTQLEKTWEQIAIRFKDYGDYLIFETMNEPREVGSSDEWNGGSEEHRDVVNAYNLAAVNTIRATGDNNETRFIMIPQVTANPTSAMQDLIIPNNDTNIIVSMHNYNPYSFCLQNDGPDRWGNTAEQNNLKNEIQTYADHYIANGQAIVLGEWGATDKDNLGDRITYYDVFANACKDGGIAPISWIYEFDRKKLTWDMPILEDAILYAYDSTVVLVESLTLNTLKDTLYVGDNLQLSATISPENATSQEIAWNSYNTDYVKVDENGLVSAIAKGKTYVAATTIGATEKCRIVVLDTTTSANNTINQSILKAYPNPVTDNLNVQLKKSPSQIQLFSIDGKCLIDFYTKSTSIEINMLDYNNGIYILKVSSEGDVETRKLIRES